MVWLVLGWMGACQNAEPPAEPDPPAPDDTENSNDSGTLTPIDEPTLDVVQVIPEDGWINVAPLQSVVVRFDAELDRDSLTSATFEAVDHLDLVLDLTLHQVGPNAVELVPVWPWPTGHTVQVSLAGLRSIDGAEHVPLLTAFDVHPRPRAIRSWSNVDASAPSAYISTLHDGSLATRQFYSDPGPDRTWFTPDDEPRSLDTITVLADGSVKTVRSLPDGSVSRWHLTVLDGLVTTKFNYDPGPDGIEDTDDDVITSIFETRNIPDSSHTTNAWLSSSDAGDDGLWLSADDSWNYASVQAVNRWGLTVYSIDLADPGPDRQWFTTDDVVSSEDVEMVDPEGRGEIWATVDARGSIMFMRRRIVDKTGRTATTEHLRNGEDGKWLTADDTVAFSQTRHFDANLLLTRFESDSWTERTAYTDGGLIQSTHNTYDWNYENFAEWAAPLVAGPPSTETER